MKILFNIFALLFLIMLTFVKNTYANTNIITLMLDNKSITNSNLSVNQKNPPKLPDVKRIVYIGVSQNLSINISVTNINSYIRIMGYSTNLDFVTFTREKTRAIISFRTLSAGDGNIKFQIDDKNNIIQRHIYSINITNITNIENNSKQPPSMPSPPIPNFTPLSQENENTTDNKILDDKARVAFDIANSLYESKNYEKSLSAFSNIVTAYPKTTYVIDSKLAMANIYASQKKYKNAFDEYKSVYDNPISNITNKSYALYSMALMNKAENKNDEAIAYFLEVIEIFPETQEALNSSYEYALQLNKKRMGKNYIDRLSSIVFSDKDFNKKEHAIILLADIYEKSNEYQKSYETYAFYTNEYKNFGIFKDKATKRMKFLERNFLKIK